MEFEAEIYGGGTFRLSDLRGKVVVIVVAQTTCSHCRKFLPAFANAWRSESALMSGKYVVAVVMLNPLHPFSNEGVSEDKKAFDSAYPPSNWVLLPEAWHAIDTFGVKYTASVIIIDSQGELVEKVEPQKYPKIEEMVSYTIRRVKEIGSITQQVKLSLKVPRVAILGDSIEIRGEVMPASAAVNITIIKPSGSETLLKPRVAGNGEFRVTLTLDSEGVWVIRAQAGSEVREQEISVLPNKPRGLESYEVLYGTHDERAGKVMSEKAKRAKELPEDNVILLGGPKANPLVPEFNSIAGVSIILRGSNTKLFIKDKEYDLTVRFGKEDYAVVYWLRWEGRFVVVGEGITRFGTIAASIFMKMNQLEEQLFLIHWIDSNGNGEVDPSEIEVLMSLSNI